jgi:hypothetical protein
MSRTFYRLLLRLHPPAFRRQFADEMLWIFDQAAGAAAVWLLCDAFVSLARQWLLRSAAWKWLAAGAGAIVQVTAGGLGLFLVRRHRAPGSPFQGVHTEIPADMARLIYLAVWAVGGVVCGVIVLSLWVKQFTRRRIHDA